MKSNGHSVITKWPLIPIKRRKLSEDSDADWDANADIGVSYSFLLGCIHLMTN